MTLRAIAFAMTAALGCTSYGFAACGPGKVPTYNDIIAVRFVRTDCFGTCPNYEVLIWAGQGLWYVGKNYVARHGTYQAPVNDTLVHTRNVLEAYHFFSLNDSENYLVTDVPHLIVAVERCRVTTKLDWPDSDFEHRPDITSLFDALDATVKTRIGIRPATARSRRKA